MPWTGRMINERRMNKNCELIVTVRHTKKYIWFIPCIILLFITWGKRRMVVSRCCGYITLDCIMQIEKLIRAARDHEEVKNVVITIYWWISMWRRWEYYSFPPYLAFFPYCILGHWQSSRFWHAYCSVLYCNENCWECC